MIIFAPRSARLVNLRPTSTMFFILSIIIEVTCARSCVINATLHEWDCGGVGLDSILWAFPTESKTIVLSSNNIVSIPTRAFSNLSSLEQLYLNTNSIAEISSTAFVDLTSLENMDMSSNLINEILPGTFATQSQLKTLFLYSNRIEFLSEGCFDGLGNLEFLWLFDNRITMIGLNSLKPLSTLLELSVRSNNIHVVAANSFQWVPELNRLIFSSNPLECSYVRPNTSRLNPTNSSIVCSNCSLTNAVHTVMCDNNNYLQCSRNCQTNPPSPSPTTTTLSLMSSPSSSPSSSSSSSPTLVPTSLLQALLELTATTLVALDSVVFNASKVINISAAITPSIDVTLALAARLAVDVPQLTFAEMVQLRLSTTLVVNALEALGGRIAAYAVTLGDTNTTSSSSSSSSTTATQFEYTRTLSDTNFSIELQTYYVSALTKTPTNIEFERSGIINIALPIISSAFVQMSNDNDNNNDTVVNTNTTNNTATTNNNNATNISTTNNINTTTTTTDSTNVAVVSIVVSNALFPTPTNFINNRSMDIRSGKTLLLSQIGDDGDQRSLFASDQEVEMTYIVEPQSCAVGNVTLTNTPTTFECSDDTYTTTSEWVCSFWNTSLSDWRDDGCTTTLVGPEMVTCSCNHLTGFAVLIRSQRVENPSTGTKNDEGNGSKSGDNTDAVLAITWLGIAVSTLCCLTIIVVYAILGYENGRTVPKMILTHICGATIFFMLMFVISYQAPLHDGNCKTAGVFLHYGFVCLPCWFLMEGVHLWRSLMAIPTNRESEEAIFRKYMAFAYGCPLVIMLVVFFSLGGSCSSVYPTSNDGSNGICFLRLPPANTNETSCDAEPVITDEGLTLIKALPLVGVYVANMLILIIAVAKMNEIKKSKPGEVKVFQETLKAVVPFQVTMGLPWLFLLIGTIDNDDVAAQYAVGFLTAFSGLWLFIFVFARDPNAKNYVRSFTQSSSAVSLTNTATSDSTLPSDPASKGKKKGHKQQFAKRHHRPPTPKDTSATPSISETNNSSHQNELCETPPLFPTISNSPTTGTLTDDCQLPESPLARQIEQHRRSMLSDATVGKNIFQFGVEAPVDDPLPMISESDI